MNIDYTQKSCLQRRMYFMHNIHYYDEKTYWKYMKQSITINYQFKKFIHKIGIRSGFVHFVSYNRYKWNICKADKYLQNVQINMFRFG